MEEIVFWKEVDVKDELPDNENEYLIKCYDGIICKMNLKDNEWFLIGSDDEPCYYTEEVTHWFKRIAIQILNDEEIDESFTNNACHEAYKNADNQEYFDSRSFGKAFNEGYKVMQERLIGGQGL